jgi:hypothetical protein
MPAQVLVQPTLGPLAPADAVDAAPGPAMTAGPGIPPVQAELALDPFPPAPDHGLPPRWVDVTADPFAPVDSGGAGAILSAAQDPGSPRFVPEPVPGAFAPAGPVGEAASFSWIGTAGADVVGAGAMGLENLAGDLIDPFGF